MSTLKSILILVVVCAPMGCSALGREPVDPRAAAAVVVSKNDPPPGCRELGEVSGDVVFGTLDAARTELVQNAAEGGGNFVAVDMTERHPGGYGIVGRLFQCPSQSMPHETAMRGPARIEAPSALARLTEAR
ncbi:MAG TPA: hypothetical protein VHB21_03375 [Minicystis sp.]|nr:hypothetical protein [Minicystis sp.]